MSERLGLLIVDDEVANLQKLKRTFVSEFEVCEARSGEEALDLLRRRSFAAIICDQRMPGISGVALLQKALEEQAETVRIILTGYTDVEDLMDAINRGQVHRYITKPWDPASLRQVLSQELERWSLRRENERLNRELRRANESLQRENYKLRQEVEILGGAATRIVYKSRAMEGLLGLLDRVVGTDSTVLIQGETGTGKELLARYIHENSPRREQPFVPVNCGAVPADLVESAFFGHKKGAFTGASQDRKGFFELAHQGTIFLDEIGEAPSELQVKLLRVLQEGEIFPVGAQKSLNVDVRVIASTNRNLAQMAETGHFRQDLYFRLNVFSVLVPPLRARREDILPLSRYFLEQASRRLNKEIPGFEPSTMEILRAYAWPGNVRELENEVERMAILAEAGRRLSSLFVSERIRFAEDGAASSGSLKEELARLERRIILDALKRFQFNKSKTAEALGVSRQTIIAKLKQYDQSKSS